MMNLHVAVSPETASSVSEVHKMHSSLGIKFFFCPFILLFVSITAPTIRREC